MKQPTTGTKIDLSAIREKLANTKGPYYWRSLEEVANTPEFQAFIEDEFPSRADDFQNPATRREVLQLLGAAIAMAGITGCTRQPKEAIVPYVRQPEEIVLGRPLFFATAMPFRGSSIGLLVESREGRPIKVEGNPNHPGSLGRTMPWNQTSTYDLYDPDRSQAVMYQGRISGWGQFLSVMAQLKASSDTGDGLHILTERLDSPTAAAQRSELQKKFPKLQWHSYDAVAHDSALEGARLAFGEPVNTIYLLERADTIVSLDADFLFSMPASIPYARAFLSRRHAEADRSRMNRLYVFEPAPTPTGDKADHKFPARAGEIEPIARALAAAIGVQTGGAAPQIRPELQRAVDAIGRELQEHKGSSVVIPGEGQPPAVHALAHVINQALGNTGKTVVYTEVSDSQATPGSVALRNLVDAMKSKQVRALLMLGCNPVYDAPADLDFLTHFRSVPLRIHAGLHQDETAVLCDWHVPISHYLESWSDTVTFDGTVSIIQPLIAPLYDSRTVHEILGTLTDRPGLSSYEIVRDFWRRQYAGGDFEGFWRQSVHDGVMPRTALPQKTVSARPDAIPAPAALLAAQDNQLEIVFRPDPSVWDGRFSNNAWLQELPKPHTTITWDNVAHLSPRTAQRLDLQNGDLVQLQYRGRSVRAPAWITPGHADNSVSVFFGYGRYRGGRNAVDRGFNAYALRTSDALHFGTGLDVRKLHQHYPIAVTQEHHSMEGREVVRSAANQAFLEHPDMFKPELEPAAFSLYREYPYPGYRWGMTIDLTACIGCNACVVACMAENNVPVVGKEQVRKSREMHWLRIAHYHAGELDNPASHFQPVLCMHCEKAPCEPVCPVAATVHSGDGLNQMVYNRCIGTRYCSNNCPYKVRRFNFLLFQDWNTPSFAALRNPEVTVRSRGVMEKCTFCIQRIQSAKIESEKEQRRIRDGEIVTACQGACPADAIVFGDLNDPKAHVTRLKKSPLAYDLLAELGTQPRVSYLAELRNPNPQIEGRGSLEGRH